MLQPVSASCGFDTCKGAGWGKHVELVGRELQDDND